MTRVSRKRDLSTLSTNTFLIQDGPRAEKHTHSNSAERRKRPNKHRRRILTVAAVVGILFLLRPLCVEILLWRGAACIEQRSHDRALLWIKAAGWLTDDNAEQHYLLARCHRRLQRFDQVEAHLKKAFQLGWPRALLEREQLLALAQTGQYEDLTGEWAELFETAGSDGPEISEAFVVGCLARLRLRDASRVLIAWETDYPQDARPHILRGRLSECLLDWTPAARSYSKALEIKPQSPDAQLGLARSLMKLGKYAEAEGLLQTLVRQHSLCRSRRIVANTCASTLKELRSLARIGQVPHQIGTNRRSASSP